VQWEYGRLNMEYTVVSKRKIAKLIQEGIVMDWNDPRLFTLSALRRRGFPPEAINYFCSLVGVSTALSTVEPAMLDACVRNVLEKTAPRTMVVLNPLKVTITNYPADFPNELEVPDFPNALDRGSHKVAISNVIYIDSADFKTEADNSFRRLTCKQSVGLRYAGLVLFLDKIISDSEIHVRCKKQAELLPDEKPKAFIHWVSKPIKCEVRIFERLFNHKNPEDSTEVPGGFLSDCGKNTLKTLDNAMADAHLGNAAVLAKYQFEREGYFCVDLDTTPRKLVMNRTLPLKEDPNKN